MIGHVYRQFIFQDTGIWDICIDDITANDEGCTVISRSWSSVYSEYQSYETQNTNDQMGPKCCVGAPLNIGNMHYEPIYRGNRSYVGPLSGTNMFTVGSQPSDYQWEWMNSTTFEAYTRPH